MPASPRIALIHATRVAMEPVEQAAQAIWPEAEFVSLLEEALSVDRASGRVAPEKINNRIIELARYAERELQPAGILFTCSAFGEGIEEAARTSPLPVLKPNEAMFEAAFTHGNKIAMIYTFAPAVKGMEREFAETAAQLAPVASMRTIYAEGAMDALKNGDATGHNKLVAQAAKKAQFADAILLAHFSTAQAATLVQTVTSIPVLSSPEAAVLKIRHCIEAPGRGL